MDRACHCAIAVTLASALAACGSAAVGPSASVPSATSAPTLASSAAPTATPAPPVTRRFGFGKALVVSPQLAGATDLFINPGAVIESSGVLHMFANAFSTWPGEVHVAHLTSTDGIIWNLDKQMKPLDTNDFELADPGADVSTGYVAADGTWVLLYESVSSAHPWKVARITAPGPGGPWTVDDSPVLEGGAAGSFDAGGIAWPSVVKVGDRWAMYYAGFDQLSDSGKGSIAVAFSDDGRTWTKQPAPILSATEHWELGSLDRPRVVATPSGLVMVYAGRDLGKRAIATSTDGLTWIKVPGPNAEIADFPISKTAWDCALLYRNGELEYFLEIGYETTNVYRGTLTWP